MPRISLEGFEKIARERVPFIGQLGIEVEQLGKGMARARIAFRDDFIRPGGPIAGPLLMGLADLAMYGAVVGLIGRVELAVTINLNINFLRRPHPGDMIAEDRILKLGKRLAVGEVALFRDGDEVMVAHVTSTYSIPPQR